MRALRSAMAVALAMVRKRDSSWSPKASTWRARKKSTPIGLSSKRMGISASELNPAGGKPLAHHFEQRVGARVADDERLAR